MPMDEPRPRGTLIGRQISGPPLSEAEHFKRCPLCGGYVDMRDRVWLVDQLVWLGLRPGAAAKRENSNDESKIVPPTCVRRGISTDRRIKE
jgi:hypothetical protein